MIDLTEDRLTFTFPEITRQLTTLLEQHIQQLLPTLRLPEDRISLVNALVAQIEAPNATKQFRSEPGPQRSEDTFAQSKDEPRKVARVIRKVPVYRRPPPPYEALHATARALTAADVEKAVRARAAEIVDRHGDFAARVTFEFQQTLRIPDDGKTYPLPASLGRFPLRSVDDFTDTIPASWVQRGGVLMPMYQSEALWINFSALYPFAVKIAAGKINTVSGEPWSPHLQREPQNYLVLPDQPWLDGFSVGEGLIRQFVAMPLGAGYSVEEELTGQAEFGGIQLQAYPLSAEAYYRDEVAAELPSSLCQLLDHFFDEHLEKNDPYRYGRCFAALPRFAAGSMGLGAGGKMQQEIYRDPRQFADWDQTQTCRCFVHLCNSLVWRQVTGTNPPHPPLTAKEYQQARIPWFDYYRDDLKPLKGSKRLAGVKSVAQLGQEKNSQPLPENSSIAPELIVQYGNTRRPGEIREFLDTP